MGCRVVSSFLLCVRGNRQGWFFRVPVEPRNERMPADKNQRAKKNEADLASFFCETGR